jgi:putative transposase
MERHISFAHDEFYHLYNRGVEKRMIFKSRADYQRFLMLLYLSNSTEEVHVSNTLKNTAFADVFNIERATPLVAIGAYCLMPNHFHILATPIESDGISRFILKLQTGYAMYFNKRNERSGSLFQGPYKAQHADTDEYLKYLFSYIHLNPAKLVDPGWKNKISYKTARIRSFVEDYPYSSLREYRDKNFSIVSPDAFPHPLTTQEGLNQHLTDWIENIKGNP